MQAILIATALLATPDFPAAMQQDLNLQAPPRCTVCHATDAGGAGTVVQPFGVYLLSRGLRPFDESSLRNALLAAAGERHSSNAEGVLDIGALKAGQNPNGSSGGTGGTDPTPAYGCSTSGPANALSVLALGIWLCTRRGGGGIRDGSHPDS